jgi:hypothetical protein
MAKIGETKINMHSNQIQYLNKAIQRSETDTIVNKAIQSSETGTTKKVNPILFKGSDTIVNKAIQSSEIGTTKKVNHILFKGSQASFYNPYLTNQNNSSRTNMLEKQDRGAIK